MRNDWWAGLACILSKEGSPGETSEDWQMYKTLKETTDISKDVHRYYIPNKSGNRVFFGLWAALYNTRDINSEEQFPRSRKFITLEAVCSRKLPAKIKYPLPW